MFLLLFCYSHVTVYFSILAYVAKIGFSGHFMLELQQVRFLTKFGVLNSKIHVVIFSWLSWVKSNMATTIGRLLGMCYVCSSYCKITGNFSCYPYCGWRHSKHTQFGMIWVGPLKLGSWDCVFCVVFIFTAPAASAVYALALSSSVCLSQVGVLLKWLNIKSRKQNHMVAAPCGLGVVVE